MSESALKTVRIKESTHGKLATIAHLRGVSFGDVLDGLVSKELELVKKDLTSKAKDAGEPQSFIEAFIRGLDE
jgi:hypothetical protein